MKRRISIILIAMISLIISSNLSVMAYELPHAFWGLDAGYSNATSSKNYDETINYGVQIINLISSEPKNEQTINILGSRTYDVAFAYFMNGDYTNAAKYFEMYIPYGKQLGWTDGVIIAENCVKQFTNTFDVYQATEQSQKVYGAKNEPNGVLYGQVADQAKSNESMTLLYLEYGDESTFGWTRAMLDKAETQNKAVEIALNFPQEGTTARNINSSDSFLSNLRSMLSSYKNVPIYLRIGAEFNVWGDKCTPDEFVSAFKAVANSVSGLSNVATVWSMAHTSSWKTNDWPYTADDFYPGDEYVDWVGVNCYASKYFQGRVWQGESRYNEVYFKTGYSSDPVVMIKDAVEKYGGRKPIMISECGSAYRTNGDINETDSEWAAKYLKQIYTFIPMVYPQVKLIAYFNAKMNYEVNYYNLDGDSELQNAYNDVTESPWFIQNNNTNSAGQFLKKAGSTITMNGDTTLYAYPHIYGSDWVNVEYYLDGELVKSTNEIAYTVQLSDIKGTHDLRVVANGNNGVSMTREYQLVSYAPAEKAEDFSDTSYLNNGQKNAVNYTISNDIMTGYENNTFRPDATITRAEFAAVICRMMGYNVGENSTFTDTKYHWSSKYVNACVKADIIHGIGDNKFAPDNHITVEQAVKILTSAYGYANSKTQYPDGFMSAAQKYNLFDNVTSSRLGTDVKRIDVAVMLYNAAKN